MKIFGLQINFQNLFQQVGHAFTVVMGLLVSLGFFDQNSVNQVTDAAQTVVSGVGALSGSALTAFHGMGWVGFILGVINWLLHNTEILNALAPKPAVQPGPAAPTPSAATAAKVV